MRRYHHGDLRNALLTAARALLEAKGASALAVREIARQVGVTAPAAYHHFSNLDDIILGLAQVAAEELAATLREAGSAPSSRLLGMGKAYIAFACRNPQLYRLLFGDGLSTTSPARVEIDRLQQQIYTLISAELPRAAETGDTCQRGVFIWSVAHGLSLLLIDDQIAAADREALIDSVLKLAGRGLRP